MLRPAVRYYRHELAVQVGQYTRDVHPLLAEPAMPGRLDGSRTLGVDLQRGSHPERVDRRGVVTRKTLLNDSAASVTLRGATL